MIGELKVGDWVIFDLDIGLITEIREGGGATFSNGCTEISGSILGRCRPLTLKGKLVVDAVSHHYNSLRDIDGSAGFNYPAIVQHFARLTLEGIDNDPSASFSAVDAFVRQARSYVPEIQGVKLFRPAGRCQ